jgi:hypothetical protein
MPLAPTATPIATRISNGTNARNRLMGNEADQGNPEG